MYYSVKLNWLEPKDGTEEMQKHSKQFVVSAESVTDAEATMVGWTPSNYQDAVVEEVKKTSIGEIRVNGVSEVFWSVKVMDDFDGTQKAKPYFVIYNGSILEDVVKLASKEWSGNDIEEVKKFKMIVDEDLAGLVKIVTP